MQSNLFRASLCALLCCVIGTGRAALADNFELRDGSTLKGSLRKSADGTCSITRSNGTVFNLSCAEIVHLPAPSQPVFLPEAAQLRIAGSNTIGAKLMPALMVDFVRRKGAANTSEVPRTAGQDHVFIEPSPAVAGVWNSVEISANGSSTGFQSLAALAIQRQLAGANPASVDAPADGRGKTEDSILKPQLDTASLWNNIDSSARGSAANPQRLPNQRAVSEVNLPTLTAFAQGRAAADFAMASRRITPTEVAALSSLGRLDQPAAERVIALDGLAIILNRANRVETLSREQIAKIFTRQITDWEQVGGWPGAIALYARAEGSGTLDTFKHIVLRGATLAADATRFEDSRELSSAVASHPNAIGFIGMSYIGETKAVNIHECNLVYPPSTFNAKTEEYPLSRRLFLYAPESHSQGLEALLDYTNSAAAQQIVAQNGFVNLSIEPDFNGDQRRLRLATPAEATRSNRSGRVSLPIDPEFSGEQRRLRLASFTDTPRHNHDDDLYTGMLKDGGRLSVTLRFSSSSADINRLDLDSRAIYDLQRIRDYMLTQGKGRRLRLVGFTDAVGKEASNRALSLARASSIANELKDVPIADVLGLGSAFPVACNDSDEGRERNRRVEIWITK